MVRQEGARSVAYWHLISRHHLELNYTTHHSIIDQFGGLIALAKRQHIPFYSQGTLGDWMAVTIARRIREKLVPNGEAEHWKECLLAGLQGGQYRWSGRVFDPIYEVLGIPPSDR